MVLIAVRVHPFPSRTRKLSSPAPKILVWRRTGKIGNANTKDGLLWKSVFFCFAVLLKKAVDKECSFLQYGNRLVMIRIS